MRLFWVVILFYSIGSFSQQKNISKIDNHLNSVLSFSEDEYFIKSFVETNPNYDVYYIQQKFNDIEIHNAISTMSIKNGEVKSFKNKFIDKTKAL